VFSIVILLFLISYFLSQNNKRIKQIYKYKKRMTESNEEFIIQCPHCDMCIEVVKLNCRIFRHGVYKRTGKQIPPHLDKPTCDSLFETGQIYGCGKPFKIEEVHHSDINALKLQAFKCDYI
jgi:hypothetical protein